MKPKQEDEENSAEGDTSTGDDSGDDGGAGVDSKVDGDSNAGDDEDMWDELQREVRKENILETKSKETHPVHCPYFPSVSLEFPLLSLLSQCSLSQCLLSVLPQR